MCGRFSYLVGLFSSFVGLFSSLVGLFSSLVGLFLVWSLLRGLFSCFGWSLFLVNQVSFDTYTHLQSSYATVAKAIACNLN